MVYAAALCLVLAQQQATITLTRTYENKHVDVYTFSAIHPENAEKEQPATGKLTVKVTGATKENKTPIFLQVTDLENCSVDVPETLKETMDDAGVPVDLIASAREFPYLVYSVASFLPRGPIKFLTDYPITWTGNNSKLSGNFQAGELKKDGSRQTVTLDGAIDVNSKDDLDHTRFYFTSRYDISNGQLLWAEVRCFFDSGTLLVTMELAKPGK